MIQQWKAQVCVRKTRQSCGEKAQEISFENTLKNTPFDMKVLAQKYVEEKTKRDGKNWL